METALSILKCCAQQISEHLTLASKALLLSLYYLASGAFHLTPHYCPATNILYTCGQI